MPLPDEVVKGLFALGGGVLGATIGAIIKGVLDSRSREYRELTIGITRPVPLVVTAKQVASRVEVYIDGNKAEGLTSSEVQIVNTGNRAILDLRIRLLGGIETEIIAAEDFDIPLSIDLKISFRAREVALEIPHLNPTDGINLRILTQGKECSIQPIFGQPDVALRVRRHSDRRLTDPAATFFFEFIRRDFFLHRYFRFVFSPYRKYLEGLARDKSADE